MPITARDLLETWTQRLAAEQQNIERSGVDQPIGPVAGRLLHIVGTLYLYEFQLPAGRFVDIDTPLSIVPAEDVEATEGLALSCRHDVVLVQTFDALGQAVSGATLIPDRAGFFATAQSRLAAMLSESEAFRLGPADRLAPVLETPGGFDEGAFGGTSILSAIWSADLSIRRRRIASLAIELIRANKRILLVCPDHHAADEVAGVIAQAMKAVGMQHKTWMSRYELALAQQASGTAIQDLGFEAQMHQFYAKSRADKAVLRRKYERFRELTPLLAYKSQKQKDLDEVRLLEWRLLTQISELQDKTKEAQAILAEYDNLPLLQRLTMQAVGKNVGSLHQYLELYAGQIAVLTKELLIARTRIAELAPEAAVPKDMRPEFEELKEDIIRLGGTKKIRELLAAEEDTNRQAFLQNRRLVITTAARVLGDGLFGRVRFDVLIAEDAPRIPAVQLLGASGLVRERIVLAGNQHDIHEAGLWSSAHEISARSRT